MNKNKVIFSSVVFMVVFSILYWYQELLGLKEANMVEQAIISNCDFQLSFLVALLSAALFLVLTYHKKEIDPNVLREEFVRSKFSNRETEIFEELSVEKQQGILKYYQNHFKREDWNDCDRYIVNHQPKTNKTLKLGLLGFVLCALMLALNPVYDDYALAREQHNEVLRAKEAEYNRIIEEQYLTFEGLPTVEIIPGNYIKAGDLQKYLDEHVRTQPQFLLDNCRVIRFCEPQNFDSIATSEGVDTNNRGFGTYAYAKSDDFSITLQMDVNKDYDQKSTVSHELTHLFDFAHGNSYTWYGISESAEWLSLHQSAPDCLGAYGTEEVHEFFADAGEMYVNYPEELKEINMDIFNFMNGWYHMY